MRSSRLRRLGGSARARLTGNFNVGAGNRAELDSPVEGGPAMNGFLIVRPVVVLATFVLLCTAFPAQEATRTAPTHQPKCAEIHAIAGMAGARSTTALTAWKSKASDSYRAKV